METSNAARIAAGAGVGAALFAWICRRRRKPCCTGGSVLWAGEPQWSADGMMTNVSEANTFLDAETPCYQHYPESVAQALLGMDPVGSAPQPEFRLEYGPSAGSGEVDVRITIEHDDDDSVAATRYLLTFVDGAVTGGASGVFRLVAGLREFRCQPGRGHADWDTTPCL
ncbi:MAG: hypothetical protein ACK5H2_04910 [Beutenbergiaceae bacterium]